MSEPFDPYRMWLGIPANEQPPNHYRLLGLKNFESNAEAINYAADRQVNYVKAYLTGNYAQICRRVLDELQDARNCLLDPNWKGAYDVWLRLQLGVPDPAAAPQYPVAFQTTPLVQWPPMAQSMMTAPMAAPLGQVYVPGGQPGIPVAQSLMPLQPMASAPQAGIPVAPAVVPGAQPGVPIARPVVPMAQAVGVAPASEAEPPFPVSVNVRKGRFRRGNPSAAMFTIILGAIGAAVLLGLIMFWVSGIASSRRGHEPGRVEKWPPDSAHDRVSPGR